jgi:Kef-type K+ transport system membrane component KefB
MGGVDGFLNGGYVFNTDIALLLMQILIITILSRAIGALIRLIKEPTVIAELLAGIILGPTVLGRIPNFTDTIFPDSSLPMLKYDTALPLHY